MILPGQSLTGLYLVINDQDDKISYYGSVNRTNETIQTRLDEISVCDLLSANYSHSISDMTFVGNKLLVFTPSNDAHTTYAYLGIFDVNWTDMTLSLSKSLRHNFGHVNTVDYCEKNDTLVLGNGGASSNTEPDQIYIVENFSAYLSQGEGSNITLSEVAKIIDLDEIGLDWGKQVNVLWAPSNIGAHDMVYAISNDGITQTFRLLQLGKGSNAFEYGTALSATENAFNGTFRIVSESTRAYSTSIANNGTQAYNGIIYETSGHFGIHVAKNSIIGRAVKSEFVLNDCYDENGSFLSVVAEGMAIKNGIMFIGYYVTSNGTFSKLGISMYRV